MPSHGKGPPKRQFCPHGHDTFAVGRNRQGMCLECKRSERYHRWRSRSEEEKKRRREDQRVERAILAADTRRQTIRSAALAISARLKEAPQDFEAAAIAALQQLPDVKKRLRI